MRFRAAALLVCPLIAATAVAAAGAAAWGAAGSAVGSAVPIETRIEVYSAGLALLDAGENAKAAAYFERALDRHPGLIEAADGLVEARSRLCAPMRAVTFATQSLKSLSGTEHELFKSYLDGARSRIDRKFIEAATLFANAAAAGRRAGDSLSAAICDRSRMQCFLAIQDAAAARASLERLRSALARQPAPDHLLIEAEGLEADWLNLSDRLDRADSLYRATLSRARARRYRQIESLCLTGIGRLEDKRQRDTDAKEFYATALGLERSMRSPERSAALLNKMGQVEIRLGELANAARHLAEAQKLAESCGQKWILAYVYYGQGALAQANGDKQGALKLFQRSLAAHRDEANAPGELDAHLRLGYVYGTLGEYTRAIAHYEHALAAYEEMKNRYGLGWTLGGLALAHHKLGDFAKAEDYYRRALEIRRELGDERGAAWCLSSMGMIADMRGRCRNALSFENEALAIYEKLGDRSGVGVARFSIGSIHFYLGNYAEAVRQYEQAFAVAEETGDEELLVKVVGGMGPAYLSTGRVDLARSLYERCLALARKSKEESEIVWALNNLASLSLQGGEREEARRHLREALSLLPRQGQDPLRARTLYLLGDSYGVEPPAGAYLEQALSLAEGSGLEELKWKCLSGLGELRLAQGDTAKAYSFQHRAIVTVESLRRLAGSDELRRHFLEPAILPYERIVSLILNRPGGARDVREAFSYTERCRAQSLASVLREALDRAGRQGDEKTFARERELLSRLTFYQARLQDGALTPEDRTAYLDKIDGIEGRFVNLKLQLDRSDKAYAAALYPQVEQPEELLSTLETGECLLSYFLGEKRSVVFVGKGRELHAYEIAPRAEIEQRVGNFLTLLRQLAGGTESSPADSVARSAAAISRQALEAVSAELYALLIGPVAGELGSKGSLIIVPDGLLNRLPFALLAEGGRYLVQDRDISYAPSLRTLRYLRARGAVRARSRHTPKYNIIAIGCSGVASAGSLDSPRVYPCTEIPIEPLPGAVVEAKRVASIFPQALVLTGAAAVESSVKSIPIDDTGILHIEAHAYVDNEDLRRSFIVLNPERSFADTLANPSEDGLLQWHEVTALRLNAALVTLAACRSSNSILSAAEGVTGLTQAFLYAGANCVLASQMDVPDKLAGAFMAEFYRNVRGGSSAAVALRAAQLEAIEREDALEEPAVWGAFVAIGDGRSAPRLSRELSATTTLAFVLLALAAAAILINLFKRRPIF